MRKLLESNRTTVISLTILCQGCLVRGVVSVNDCAWLVPRTKKLIDKWAPSNLLMKCHLQISLCKCDARKLL